MSITLTEEQRRAAAEAGGGPVPVNDPETDTAYVLVRADIYERLRAVVDGISRRAGWDDPEMDVFDRYRKPS
jgi:hypothetical protein